MDDDDDDDDPMAAFRKAKAEAFADLDPELAAALMKQGIPTSDEVEDDCPDLVPANPSTDQN